MTKFQAGVFVGCLLASVLAPHSYGEEPLPTVLKSLSEPWGSKVKMIPPQQISKDKCLVAAGSTLYMLNQRREVQWKFDAEADINGFAYVPKMDSVYIVAMDLTWVAVDVKSGKKRWSMGANGRATFAEIAAYGTDKYVVVTNMSGYDSQFMDCSEKKAEGKAVECKREDPDTIDLMQDRKAIGTADFPPDARLAVVGQQVWAISRGKDSVSLKEIEFKKPK